MRKILAVLEVSVVTFGVIPLLTTGVYRLFPRFESWQTETLGFPFPVFVDGVMAAVALALIRLRREPWAAYGLTWRPLRYHLDLTATCFIPVALAGLPLGLGLNYKQWEGALVLAAVQLALLGGLARLLRHKPTATGVNLLGVGVWLLPLAGGPVGKALANFLTYAVFVGFGEEILYRGYMHSRLNAVFGRPYTFYEVRFGWGTLIAAFLFGLTHVGVLRWLLGADTTVTLAWGFWTFFAGLVFAYVREKSGSILAPALLHGLPQAIATALLALF